MISKAQLLFGVLIQVSPFKPTCQALLMGFNDTGLVAASLVCTMPQLALPHHPGDKHYMCLCLHCRLNGKSHSTAESFKSKMLTGLVEKRPPSSWLTEAGCHHGRPFLCTHSELPHDSSITVSFVAVVWDSISRPGWPLTHSDPPASAGINGRHHQVGLFTCLNINTLKTYILTCGCMLWS